MTYTLVWSPAFIKQLQQLSVADAQLIANNVTLLVREPRAGVGTILELSDTLYVVRIGRYDIAYEVDGYMIRLLNVTVRPKS